MESLERNLKKPNGIVDNPADIIVSAISFIRSIHWCAPSMDSVSKNQKNEHKRRRYPSPHTKVDITSATEQLRRPCHSDDAQGLSNVRKPKPIV